MNVPANIVAGFTLADLDAVFERLGDDGQIQLIAHLSRKMACADGIDIKALGWEYADCHCPADATDGEREAAMESVLYPRVFRDGCKPITGNAEAIAVKLERLIAAIQRTSGIGGAA